MYRDRIEELRKEKGLSYKQLSELSGVSLDTLYRIVHPENPEKDSPRINTLDPVCKALGIEVWELFYTGSTSLVVLQSEIATLRLEKEGLIAENATLAEQNRHLNEELGKLKDKLIEVLLKADRL